MVASESGPEPPFAVALLTVGSGFRVLQANDAAGLLFGLPADALLGLSLEQLVPTDRRGELRNVQEVLSGGSPRRLRTVIRMADGRRVDVSASLSAIKDAAGAVHAVSIQYEPAQTSTVWLRSSLTPPSPSLPPRSPSGPAPRPSVASERRLAPTGGKLHVVTQRLVDLDRLLARLAHELGECRGPDLDRPQLRDRLLLQVSEARELAQDCRIELSRVENTSMSPPPRVPKL